MLAELLQDLGRVASAAARFSGLGKLSLRALTDALPGLQDIKFNVHAHPTLSEVLDELFKQAHMEAPTKRPDPKPASMHRLPVAA